MKKIILALSLFVAVASSYAQGTVTLANAAATAITNTVTGLRAATATLSIGLYGSTSLGLSDDTALALIGATGSNFAPGLFSLGSRSIGNPGDTVTLQVRAWSGNYATYEAALASGDSAVVLGKSAKWEQPTGGGTNPAQPITGAGRLTAFVVAPAVPEPSTIALGLLGLGAVALFRRRK